jgi:phosphoglycolate phosphatase
LFDLDGTLTDPVVGISNSIRHALTALSLASMTDDELRGWVGPPLHESFGSLGLSPERVVDAIAAYREYFTDRGLYENTVYAGIEPVLVALRAAEVRLAVASSKPTVFVERILEHFGLRPHFEAVVGSELDGSRIHKHDVIVEALAQLGDPHRDATVMVGDREHDMRGATEAGLVAIGVAWGYAAEGELEAAGAAIVVATPADLLAHLLGVEGHL